MSENTNTIRPCGGTCGRMTRPGNITKAQAPNTVQRQTGDKCASCLGNARRPLNRPNIRICKGTCGRWTRPAGVRPERAPEGAVVRVDADYCSTCAREARGEPVRHGARDRHLAPRDWSVKVCTGTCGRNTRHHDASATEYPGTVRRRNDGLCDKCHTDIVLERRKAAPEPEPIHWRRQITKTRANDTFDPERVGPDADPHLVKMATAFTMERRARLARASSFAVAHAANMSRRGVFA